jgi:8-hydroxy-5-deazaflavin:NADPH oxidoreductase
MQIGIIGAGPLGTSLARLFRRVGHSVRIANSRGPHTLHTIAADIGATAVAIGDAVKDVDAVFIAVPMKRVGDLSHRLFHDVSHDVVIVDANNYYPERDGRIDEIDGGTIESHYVAARIGRSVVKGFNNMLSQVLAAEARPAGTLGRLALPIAGDDEAKRAIVLRLVDAAGFDAVDAGGLGESWRQQPGTPVYCTDYDAEGVRKALARADRAAAPKARDVVWNAFAQIPAGTTPEAFASLVRAISRSANV